MRIAVPKEKKAQEYRVALTPAAVGELVAHGHQVCIEAGAGLGIGAADDAYRSAGAVIEPDATRLLHDAELIVKVKEPQPEERRELHAGQMLFAYLHLAADADQANDLLRSGAVCIAFETVTSSQGRLPLLLPMSEIAGKLAVQAGAVSLHKAAGGSGILLGGAPGVQPAKVLVLGAGAVGLNATSIAVGMGAEVTVMDRSVDALRAALNLFGSRIKTELSSEHAIRAGVRDADLLIGGVLVPGAAAPKLINRTHLRSMKLGAVVVDVSVYQGGCAETTRPTTHAEPIYVEEGVVHYCVANMPGAVPRTSAAALSNAIFPHVLALAQKGWRRALAEDLHLRNGLNICEGQITHSAVGYALGLPYTDAGVFAPATLQ